MADPIFFEPQDNWPTYADSCELLAYARSHNALQFMIQNIRDFNSLGADSNQTCNLEECVERIFREILTRDEMDSYDEAFRTVPGVIKASKEDAPDSRAASAHAFLSLHDSEWLTIAVATRADVFFLALARFADYLKIDFYRILSVIQPAIIDRGWANAIDEKQVMFWDPKDVRLPEN